MHPLNPEFGFFMSHGFVLVKGNQHGHCDLVHKIWQRNHSLEYVVHHAIQMMKKKLTCSIRKKNGGLENEKYMLISLCGLTIGIVRFYY